MFKKWRHKKHDPARVRMWAYRMSKNLDETHPGWVNDWLSIPSDERAEVVADDYAAALDNEAWIRLQPKKRLPAPGAGVSRKIPAYGTNVEIEGE